DRRDDGIGFQRADLRAGCDGWEAAQLLADESDRSLYFQPTDVSPGEHVAGRPSGDRYLGKAEDSGREVVAGVALDAAGPGGRADEAERETGLAVDRAGVFETSLDGRRVPEQVGRVFHVAVGGLDPVQAVPDPVRVQAEPDAAGSDETAAEAIT